jgi:hypothetical protein
MSTAAEPARPTSWRVATVLSICAAPTVATILLLPVYGPAMDDAAIVPMFYAAFYVAPALSLAIAAAGLLGALLAKDERGRTRWLANAGAGGWAFLVIAGLLSILLVTMWAAQESR